MERLEAEIKELSFGLKGKREDAAKHGQRKVWDSYQEVRTRVYSNRLAYVDHATLRSSSQRVFWSFPTQPMN